MSNEFNLDGFSFTPDTTERSAEMYPRIWWYNGAKQAGTAGHFYTTEREIAQCPYGWMQVQRYDDEVGYTADTLRIAVIRKRSQAYSEDRTSGMTVKTWHEHYKFNSGYRIYTELLCLVEGIHMPVVWVVKGMTGKAVTGRKTGLLDGFNEAVLKPAVALWKHGAMPSWAFWMPVAGAKTDKGKPIYTDTGFGSHVTLPTLALPATVDREALKGLYIGRTLLDYGLEVYKASAEWQKTLRTNEAPSAPAPQPTDDSVEPS